MRPRAALCALLLTVLPLRASAEEIRVEVRRGVAAARLGRIGRLTEGAAASAVAIGTWARIQATAGVLRVGKRTMKAPIVARPASAALLLDGKPLPGRIEIWPDGAELAVINIVDLEDYVAAVVASEMPASWPEAALQAQAVAARTYAMAQKTTAAPSARSHVGASVLDQVYRGTSADGARRAADATRGEVLTHRAAPIQAFFSSSCGGQGESGEAAFNQPVGSWPYLPGGPDGDVDRGAPRLRWKKAVPLRALTAALRRVGRVRSPLVDVEIAERTPSGRARTLLLSTSRSAVEVPAAEVRQLLGYQELPSLLFDVSVRGASAVFEGRGSGHGAGLCQWGARGRALRGDTYGAILAHYYPGTEVRRMY